ncbi:hypothetical protein [Parendozoicomonas sp. Alg238-R29]|uniref:hypothetical protein n=1 Tax=Parendozoicomonas sp. Alg238-R29 TaxID=2993446 RepID=UPI00248F46C5|nr:hypothetical protein [Parendozoicomonas sp. Alg238-R29]
MKTMIRKALAVAVLAGVSGGVMAGTLGETSNDDFVITYTQDALNRIWGLKDVTIEDLDTATAPTGDPVACMYSNADTDVTVAAENAGSNAFLLRINSDDTAGIPYEVTLKDASDDSSLGTVKAGSTSINIDNDFFDTQPSPLAANDACTTGGNIKVSVTANSSAGDPYPEGTYKDTITLTVSAN